PGAAGPPAADGRPAGRPFRRPAARPVTHGGGAASPPALPAAPIAGLPRRWASLFYEALLLGAVLLFAGFAVLPLLDPAAGARSRSVQDIYILPPASRAFILFYCVAVTGAYCVGFWSKGRRTLPMKTWGLRLVRSDLGPVDVRRATARFAAAWIGP